MPEEALQWRCMACAQLWASTASSLCHAVLDLLWYRSALLQHVVSHTWCATNFFERAPQGCTSPEAPVNHHSVHSPLFATWIRQFWLKQPSAPKQHSKMGKPPTKKALRSKRAMMIAPGILHSYHQARRLFTKNGVKPQVATSSAIAAASGANNEPTVASTSMTTPTCTPMTVASVAPQLGVHYKMCRASLNQDAPLLQLPDDVLVRFHFHVCSHTCPRAQLKIMCALKHDELKPVLQACHRLRAAALQARNYHFNYTTPSHPAADGAPRASTSSAAGAQRGRGRPRQQAGGARALPPRATRLGSRLSRATRSSTSRTLHFATPRMLLGKA